MHAKLLDYTVAFEDGTEGIITNPECFALTLDNEHPKRLKVISESDLSDLEYLPCVFSSNEPCDFVVSTLAMPDKRHEIILLARIAGADGQPSVQASIIGRQEKPLKEDYAELWRRLKDADHEIVTEEYYTAFKFPLPISPIEAGKLMRLIINFYLEGQSFSHKKVASVKGFTLNINKFSPLIEHLATSIKILEKEKPDKFFYEPINTPEGVALISRLMKTTLPDGAEFHIPTDDGSMDIIKTFKAHALSIFELHNYYFQYWSSLLKPEFLAPSASLPYRASDMINTHSLFYLIMNHGTRGKHSTLHTLENPTHSMGRILHLVNFHWIANAHRSGYDHTKISPGEQRAEIETLNAEHIKRLIHGHDDFIQRKEPSPDAVGPEQRRTLRSLPYIQNKIISIIEETPEHDWVTLLGYTPPHRSSQSLKTLFSNETLPATIHYNLVFYFMNMRQNDGKLCAPSNPTKAMNKLLDILDKQLNLTLKKTNARVG